MKISKVFYFQALASVLGVASEIKDEVAKLGSGKGAEANGRERAKVYFPKYLFFPSEIMCYAPPLDRNQLLRTQLESQLKTYHLCSCS